MTQIKVETAYKVAKIFNVNIEFLVGLSCEKLE
jgi:hypothetical protein